MYLKETTIDVDEGIQIHKENEERRIKKGEAKQKNLAQMDEYRRAECLRNFQRRTL